MKHTCEVITEEGRRCTDPVACTVSVYKHDDIDMCEGHARRLTNGEFDAIDGFTFGELYGPEGAEWMAAVSLGERLADLKGRAA